MMLQAITRICMTTIVNLGAAKSDPQTRQDGLGIS
jgi:hypothetical protein